VKFRDEAACLLASIRVFLLSLGKHAGCCAVNIMGKYNSLQQFCVLHVALLCFRVDC
jgi:hypothetical protein